MTAELSVIKSPKHLHDPWRAYLTNYRLKTRTVYFSDMSKRGVLDYRNDCILFESTNFIALTNAFQGRSHFMIRTQRDNTSLSNDLDDFSDDVKQEFWHLVQKVVADSKVPSLLCHHFGTWRSADHFHVHLVTRKEDFAKYTASKVKNGDYQQIMNKLDSKEGFLIKRHLEEFKRTEIADIRKNPPKLIAEKKCPDEWGDFKVELDEVYPWVKFIPKTPQVFSRDTRVVLEELRKYRDEAFTQMHMFASAWELTGFRIWLKLAGDTFNWNAGRDPNNRVYGIISVYTPEYYAMWKSEEAAEEWLNRYEAAKYDILATA